MIKCDTYIVLGLGECFLWFRHGMSTQATFISGLQSDVENIKARG